MSYLIALVFCVIFVELIFILRIIVDAKSILSVAKESLGILQSNSLSDDEKEKQIRQCSLNLFKATFTFAGKVLFIILVLGLIYLLIDWSMPQTATLVAQAFSSVMILIILTAVTMIYVWIRNVFVKKL